MPAPAQKPIHPKVKATATIAGLLLTVDALIVAIEGNVPSHTVLAILGAAHTILPPLAGYLKRA